MDFKNFIKRIKEAISEKKSGTGIRKKEASGAIEDIKAFQEDVANITYSLRKAQISINHMKDTKNKEEMKEHFESLVAEVMVLNPNILLKEKAGQNFAKEVANMNRDIKQLKIVLGTIKETLEIEPLNQKILNTWIAYATNDLVLIARELEKIDKYIQMRIEWYREAT